MDSIFVPRASTCTLGLSAHSTFSTKTRLSGYLVIKIIIHTWVLDCPDNAPGSVIPLPAILEHYKFQGMFEVCSRLPFPGGYPDQYEYESEGLMSYMPPDL